MEAHSQFEYWLTISFAIIAAAFVGRKYLTPAIAITLAFLYLLTAITGIGRWIISNINAGLYTGLAIEGGAEWVPGAQYLFILRLIVFVVGTLATLWFLYTNSKHRDDDT